MLAEKFRRRAGAMTLKSYIELMQRAAIDLEAEASMLEEDEPSMPTGRHLDIRV
ncbi:MAG TPA: hypothetical protein VNU97_00370 [Rhizomicrobium sp.]|nr:hypothetical protein [Rhizomicrobium sp.]